MFTKFNQNCRNQYKNAEKSRVCSYKSNDISITKCPRVPNLAVVCVVFCHFPKSALVNIRIKGEVGAIKLV